MARGSAAALVNDAAGGGTAAVLRSLTELVSKGLPAARCRIAVEDEVARWHRELGAAAALELAAELHTALADGVEAAEQGADYDGEDKAMRSLLAAQLAGMIAARDAAAAAAAAGV